MPDIHRERKERLQPLVNKETKNHREIPQVDYSALNTKKVTKKSNYQRR